MTDALIRIIVADDHVALREGLAAFIGKQPDMQVIAQASDGEEAIAKTCELKPDVLLIDVTMPRCGGIEAIERIHRQLPEVRALVLTMHEDPQVLRSVLAAGGAGFVTKRAAGEEVLTAIRQVACGNAHINMRLEESGLMQVCQDPASTQRPRTDGVLSEREREVLTMVAHGHTNKEIGDQLGISKGSVDSYRTRISTKLNTQNRADMVKRAIQLGLFAPGAK